MALLERPAANPYQPINPEAAKQVMTTGHAPDDYALQLVIQDCQRAENFESTKQWVMQWPSASVLYQSPFTSRYWEGTTVERASVPFYTVARAVNTLVPQILKGMFYENPPFIIQQRPGTHAQAARAWGAVLAFQLEDIGFRENLRLGCVNALLFGTNIWKMGWESFTRERKMYVRKANAVSLPSPAAQAGAPDVVFEPDDDDIDEQVVEEKVDRPVLEHIVNLRHVLVDPGLNVPDIRKAKYVIHRKYMTWNDLDKLRERPGYTIPPKEELLMLFFPPKEPVEAAPNEVSARNPLWDARAEVRYEPTTADPFEQPLEVLERWDSEKVIVVLQKKLVICNDENPYGVIPFLSVGWWDVPEAFWSMGLAKTIGSEQRLQQGITNLWLDNAALNLNGVYVRVKGKSVPTQSIRIAPGKIVDVENKDDFQPLKRLDPVPEAGTQLQLSKARVDETSGASPVAGGADGSSAHSNLGRSSAGAQLIGAGMASAAEEFVEKLANQVFIPFLKFAQEMNCSLLPMANLKYILSEELQHEYMKEGHDLVELLNAQVNFSVLAAAKMQSRRNMAQALPVLIQFVTNQQTENQLAIQAKKVDTVEVLRMLFETSDWKNFNDVIVDMNPEDQKRWQMMQMGQQNAKVEGQMKLQQQAFNNKSQLVDQENISRAGRDILRQAIEHSAEPEALSGLPTATTGFGSQA